MLFREGTVKEGFPVLAIFHCFVVLKGLQKYCLFRGSLLLGQREAPQSRAHILQDAKGLEICCT